MGSVHGFPAVDAADAALGARLRHWREKRGLSVEDLARLMDLTPQEQRRIEAGRAHLDSLRVGTAISALHLPLWALTSDTRAY